MCLTISSGNAAISKKPFSGTKLIKQPLASKQRTRWALEIFLFVTPVLWRRQGRQVRRCHCAHDKVFRRSEASPPIQSLTQRFAPNVRLVPQCVRGDVSVGQSQDKISIGRFTLVLLHGLLSPLFFLCAQLDDAPRQMVPRRRCHVRQIFAAGSSVPQLFQTMFRAPQKKMGLLHARLELATLGS